MPVTTEVVFPCTGDEATRSVEFVLRQRGFQVVRSFHLMAGSTDGCSCPHHGTPECRCQYSVLLVYGPSDRPTALTVHGREKQTRVEIVVDANTPPDPEMAAEILAALGEAGARPSGQPAPRAET